MIRCEADSLGDKEDLLSALLGNDLSANAAAAAVQHGGVGEKETALRVVWLVHPRGGRRGAPEFIVGTFQFLRGNSM